MHCRVAILWTHGMLLLLLLFSVITTAQKKTIDFYLQQALSNSPLLKDYQNQVASNTIDSERLKASYLPQVTGNSLNSYSPVIKGYGYDNAITNGANISALVGVNKTLVGQKNLQTQFNAIQLASRGIENTSKITEQDLKRTISGQFITTYGDQQQLGYLNEVYNMLSKEEIVLKRLTERNVYRQTDYLTFLVTLQQQKIAVRQQTIQLQNDLATLNYLSGIVDTTLIELEAPPQSLSSLPSVENSIFFRQYTLDSLKLGNDRARLDYSYKPKVNVFADAGYYSSLAGIPYKNFGTSFGFGLTVPIYDGHQRKMQYRKLDIAEKTRQQYRDFFIRQHDQLVPQLMRQLESTRQLIDQIREQIRYSDGLIEVNSKLLVTGDVRIADMVIAINNYLTARNLLTQNEINRLQIINQINYWNR
ncbi:TolC family protein [Chitinophaga ginsengisoli]|uniref:Outer membrane protein TolC n=1 Tax=Chitinophaga ginsengisoli TaxID=363837 RepID=A0A2P8FRV8_9BACT|nr:TolC family protein [Chitinophaga ginsengisoli]PSL24437.1 outer membrane protein TolC [Chitinophaga ginsengisoli]